MLSILAHAGQPVQPHDVWGAWNLDPLLIAGIAGAGFLYRLGSSRTERPPPRWRQRSFVFGLVVVAVAVISPIDALGESLASAHMVQHLLLMLVAAPLLVLGLPTETIIRGASYPTRKKLGRARRRARLTPARIRGMSHPVVIWLLFAGVLWFWHLPGPYVAALENEIVHIIEHTTFLAAAFALWRMVLVAHDRSGGFAFLAVFTAGFQSTILAALLTFTTSPWYPPYAKTAPAFGMSALEDQQLAGVIMWVPGGLLYLTVGLALFALWVKGSARSRVPLHPGRGYPSR